jgi:hypothetical protein
MAERTPDATDERVISGAMREYRLGQTLIVAGGVIFVACLSLNLLGGSVTGSGSRGFTVGLVGVAGFALVLAGLVFFRESRAFLRRYRREA